LIFPRPPKRPWEAMEDPDKNEAEDETEDEEDLQK
jgi:hypothetical protein